MWVLETEGDALRGKRLWLPPGKKYVFGRTTSDVGHFAIANKTISRQHLIVEVGSMGATDCENVNSRSLLTLTDINTKIGTLVNGEQIRGKSHVVSQPISVVTLGRYEFHFRFIWIPVNLTFSFTAKETRAEPFAALYNRLGPLDVKVLPEYKPGITTHLVTKKRNTAKGLQALIDGRYIVHDDSYVNALVAACTASDASKSPLEGDFDGNFPNPLEFLPPRGAEPTQRDSSAYSPDPARQNMFEGYTFVCYEERQWENLQAPIFNGGGKALFEEVEPTKTTVEDFVRRVKNIAGEKGLGSFEDGSEGKGVVVVRFSPEKGTNSDWYTEFNSEVSLLLDQRLIMQNEFLDAILGNDASVLRRPLEFVQSGVVPPPPSVATAMSSQVVQSSPPRAHAATPAAEMAPPLNTTRRGRSRRLDLNQFRTGFNEDYNGPSARHDYIPEMEVNPTPTVESQSQSLFVSQDTEADREEVQVPDIQNNRRKRNSPPVNYEDDDQDIMNDVAPAMQAFKKRKIEQEAARRRRGGSTLPVEARSFAKPQTKIKTKTVEREINFQEVLAQQHAQDAEKAEELARLEREAREEGLDGIRIEDIRNLAIVEEIPVTRQLFPPRTAALADESDRWDERWNGRRNFKKFRRRGADPNTRRGAGRVIVQLEEVKEKGFGIGDRYWQENGDAQHTKKKGKGKEIQDTQSQARPRQESQAKRGGTDDEDTFSFQNSEGKHADVDSDMEMVSPLPNPAARSSQYGSKSSAKTNGSQNLPAQSQTQTQRGKRAAATTLSKPAPAKRAKPAPVVVDASDDSDDDDLKFRFARRK